jgi:hypothetical protein
LNDREHRRDAREREGRRSKTREGSGAQQTDLGRSKRACTAADVVYIVAGFTVLDIPHGDNRVNSAVGLEQR